MRHPGRQKKMGETLRYCAWSSFLQRDRTKELTRHVLRLALRAHLAMRARSLSRNLVSPSAKKRLALCQPKKLSVFDIHLLIYALKSKPF
jgi:hypothetical protein